MLKIKFIASAFLILLLAVLLLYFLFPSDDNIRRFPVLEGAYDVVPDFNSYEQVVDKKLAFFNYLSPTVQALNEYILNIREELLTYKIKELAGEALSDAQEQNIDWLMQEYRVDDEQTRDEIYSQLLRRIDVIPIELVLVQAANESAWGTSRFARKGYNFFGIWCFEKNCGFVPNDRNTGASHEVAKFKSLSHAVYAYMRNLNRHDAYKKLRSIREQRRNKQQEISAIALAEGLEQYSERGEDYVEELQDMIRFNQELMSQ